MSDRAKLARIDLMTKNLYEAMPGSQHVPHDPIVGDKLWGEVEHTPHYEFCNLVATLIVKNSGVTYVDPD